MSLKGNIQDFGLLDVLQLISQNQKSGVLHIYQDNSQFAEIYFNNGQLVDVKITSQEDDLKIGNYLVAKKIITEERLNELLEKQKKNPIRFGKLLLEENILTEKQLKEIYQNLTKSKLEKILSLEKGTYEFIAASIDYNNKEIEPIPLDSIILDTLKNIDEIKLFKKKLDNFDTVYQKETKLIDNVFLSQKQTEEPVIKKGDKFYLNIDAFTIFNLINSSNSIQDILKKSGLNEHIVLKTLFLLLNYGLIKPVKRDTTKEIKEKNKIINNIIYIFLFIIIVSLLIFNLTSLDTVKNTILFNDKLFKEVSKRNNDYLNFISKIKSIENEEPVLYHNPKTLSWKK